MLLTTLPGRTKGEKGVLIANVYQYQAVDAEDQARLLRILDRYLRKVKSQYQAIIVAGDINAALTGKRQGYVREFTVQDRQLQRFYDNCEFIDCNKNIHHTWVPYNGRPQSAVLDYVWAWTANGEGEHQVSTRLAPQQRHYQSPSW